MFRNAAATGVISIVLLVGGIGPAGAQPNTALESLSKLKDFQVGRQSSYDPSGGNKDGRQDSPIQPGETRLMAKIEGPGAITHIWATISAAVDPPHLRNLVVRMYWDGETSPSVECPIGDFFGLGHSKYYQYSSLPIQIGTDKGMNCFWRMPFAAGALVNVTNEGPEPIRAFYYYVDYQQFSTLPLETGRFHAQYRQNFPCKPGENYAILEAKGKGHYVGCNLSIHTRNDRWWGEGDDMIFIDDETEPRLKGTGSEDYFGGAWCYNGEFSNPYFGCPLFGSKFYNSLWNVYRYHIEDPITFDKSIRVTIEHGHANDRKDDFASVAYWYQVEPHDAFPALPPAAERMFKDVPVMKEESTIESESERAGWQGGDTAVQEMEVGETQWSERRQLTFKPSQPTNYSYAPGLAAPNAGSFTLEVWHTTGPDYGTCELWINDASLGSLDTYSENVTRQKADVPVTLSSGANKLELRVTGKNEKSSGFQIGVDCYRLSPVAAPAPAPVAPAETTSN
jgi:hypothetical protein